MRMVIAFPLQVDSSMRDPQVAGAMMDLLPSALLQGAIHRRHQVALPPHHPTKFIR
jgi:hypothetical protein